MGRSCAVWVSLGGFPKGRCTHSRPLQLAQGTRTQAARGPRILLSNRAMLVVTERHVLKFFLWFLGQLPMLTHSFLTSVPCPCLITSPCSSSGRPSLVPMPPSLAPCPSLPTCSSHHAEAEGKGPAGSSAERCWLTERLPPPRPGRPHSPPCSFRSWPWYFLLWDACLSPCPQHVWPYSSRGL